MNNLLARSTHHSNRHQLVILNIHKSRLFYLGNSLSLIPEGNIQESLADLYPLEGFLAIRASVNAGKPRSALQIKSLTRGDQATLIQLHSLLAQQLLMYQIPCLEARRTHTADVTSLALQEGTCSPSPNCNRAQILISHCLWVEPRTSSVFHKMTHDPQKLLNN